MKKLLVPFAILSLFFSACLTDDDDDANANPLLGSWSTSYVSEGISVKGTLTFNADSTCTYVEKWGEVVEYQESGTYSFTATEITIIVSKCEELNLAGTGLEVVTCGEGTNSSIPYTLVGNVLTFPDPEEEDEIFTKE